MDSNHSYLGAYIALLIILLLVVGFCYEIYTFFGGSQVREEQLQPYPATLPALTTKDSVAEQQSAQYLLAYTPSGFHPTTLSMTVGQMVRIINQSSGTVSITGPANLTQTLAHGAYFNYTASKAGTVAFTGNNSTVTITVTN